MVGKEGLLPPINRLWGPGGKAWLDETDMADALETRPRSLCRLIKAYDGELVKLDAHIASAFRGRPGYETIEQLHAATFAF